MIRRVFDDIGESVDPPRPNEEKNGITQLTMGNYLTEKESALAFDLHVAASGLFESFAEVPGEPGLRWDQVRKQSLRIDRILVPSSELCAMGWAMGPVGVEIKRSGTRIGPAISQMLDYRRATWRVPGGDVRLNYVFLWASGPCGGDLASIMQQQRVGGVHSDQYSLLSFHSGAAQVLVVPRSSARKIHMSRTAPAMGRKSGSR